MRRGLVILTMIVMVSVSIQSCKQKRPGSYTGDQDHLIMSVLWFQKSAENRALFLQGFNIASQRLRELPASTPGGKPVAIVTDIDETILDNSPFESWQINTGDGYTDYLWTQWTDRVEATPLPGALEFTKLAESLGVEVFYVSNRSAEDAFDTTLENLRKHGFPFADSSHLFLKTVTSSKTERRNTIMETHDIVMLLGDNLADFDGLFENRGSDFGFGDVDSIVELFGDRFIVFPNPMYGTWVNPALVPAGNLTPRQRYIRSLITIP